VIDVCCGESHTFFITAELRAVYACGSNLDGQLGIPELYGLQTNKPTIVAALSNVS